MANRENRNWSDHPIIVLIGLLASVIAIVVFLTGKQSIPWLIKITPTATPLYGLFFTATTEPSPIPTDTVPAGDPSSTPAPSTSLPPTRNPHYSPEPPTSEPPTPLSSTPIAAEPLSVEQQLAQIDQTLKQSLKASIAYNAPEKMRLDGSTTIELLLNPAISPEVLATQVTESGQVSKGSIEITPRMKAVLKAQEQDAFDIQPLHDNPEQIISGTDTTKWSWFVTAKKAGLHRLTIIVYRLVKFDGQDYWREVETYKADIDVKVTLAQMAQSLDWKWIAGFLLTLIGSILGVLTWRNNRNKELQKEEETKGDKLAKSSKKGKK